MVDITGTAPFCARNQLNGEIRTVFAGVMQLVECLLIQQLAFWVMRSQCACQIFSASSPSFK